MVLLAVSVLDVGLVMVCVVVVVVGVVFPVAVVIEDVVVVEDVEGVVVVVFAVGVMRALFVVVSALASSMLSLLFRERDIPGLNGTKQCGDIVPHSLSTQPFLPGDAHTALTKARVPCRTVRWRMTRPFKYVEPQAHGSRKNGGTDKTKQV